MDEKPSRSEEEFFKRQDADLIAEQRRKLDEARDKQERRLHYMRCPKCGGALVEKETHNIKIDVCSDCGGTWLDGGELELLARVDQSRLGGFVRTLFGMNK